MRERQARYSGICSVRESIFGTAFNELFGAVARNESKRGTTCAAPGPAPGPAPDPATAEGLGCAGVAAERGEGEEFHAPQHSGQQHLVRVRVKGRG